MRVNSGTDFQARVMGDTASTGTGSYAPCVYMALSANATAPSSTDTTLAGEIATGTLARAITLYAHTNGTSSYTNSKTFTFDQSITLNKEGEFNAASGGTLVFESLIPSPPAGVSGDQVAITSTKSL